MRVRMKKVPWWWNQQNNTNVGKLNVASEGPQTGSSKAGNPETTDVLWRLMSWQAGDYVYALLVSKSFIAL